MMSILSVTSGWADAQDGGPISAAGTQVATLNELSQKPNRWLLVFCGLPGDEEHRERLTKATRQIALSASQVFGVADKQRIVLAGDAQMVETLSKDQLVCELTTAESIKLTIAKVSQHIQPQDACWVFLLGHGNLYGKSSFFNLAGPDIDQMSFAQIASQLKCQQKLFWICTPVSGFWLRPLAAQNTVLVSATEAALEFTGTEMAYALGDVLAGESPHQGLADIDKNGNLSLLDLYLAVNVEITARFAALERLQTEHAQLDDDGDGRGRELQADFLAVDPLDTNKRGRRKLVQASIRDGKVASTILIGKSMNLESDDEP